MHLETVQTRVISCRHRRIWCWLWGRYWYYQEGSIHGSGKRCASAYSALLHLPSSVVLMHLRCWGRAWGVGRVNGPWQGGFHAGIRDGVLQWGIMF